MVLEEFKTIGYREHPETIEDTSKIIMELDKFKITAFNTDTLTNVIDKLIIILEQAQIPKLDFLRYGLYFKEEAPEPKYRVKGSNDKWVDVELHQNQEKTIKTALQSIFFFLMKQDLETALEKEKILVTQW